MSSTRHAEDGEFHQERYCSSEERGLLVNIVAKKCETVSDASDRELIWTIQLASHREGLEALAQKIATRFPDKFGTRSMQRFGVEEGQTYETSQVKAIRTEIPDGINKFPLPGELTRLQLRAQIARRLRGEEQTETETTHARLYRASNFVNFKEAKEIWLPRQLAQMCTDPDAMFSPWWFPTLRENLCKLYTERAETNRRAAVVTEICKKVWNCLDYTLESGLMTLIEGSSRTGKSLSAKEWCELHPGQTRFVQVHSESDDIGFYRQIAKAIGSASALSMKGVQLRDRIESALQSSKLMLVMDEAHYLWPHRNRREALPARINWLMTALVNYGVPVALISTPQFSDLRKNVETKTGWTSEQFLGRVGHHEILPSRLKLDDLRAVALHHLPDGTDKSIEALAAYSQASEKYLSAIETAVKRARFLAGRAGRGKIEFCDIKAAITETVGIAAPMTRGQTQAVRRGKRTVLVPELIVPDRVIQPEVHDPIQV